LPIIVVLEAERLVVFCGAGISIGTGLPDFRLLTLDATEELSGVAARKLSRRCGAPRTSHRSSTTTPTVTSSSPS